MPARPLVIAHRGSTGEGVKENTLASFQRAAMLGADMIELDVRRTADDELVVFHDHEAGGQTVGSLSLAALRELTRTDVPRLSEVLDWACGRVGLNVELKEDGYVERVAELLVEFQERGGELLVTSFADPVLAQLRLLGTALHTGLLIGVSSAGAFGRARACRAGWLVPAAELASDELLDELVGAGVECLVWDVMVATAGHAELVRDPRVAGVITNDVPGALAARASLSAGRGHRRGRRSGLDGRDPVGDDR